MIKNLEFYFSKPLTDKNFKKIYQLSSVQLFGIILRILKQQQLSEDCLQEVFVKIYHNFNYYDKSKSKPLTWMATITRNYAIDFYRKKQLPIVDNFDLSIINNEQIQMLEKLEQNDNKKYIIKCLKNLQTHISDAIFMQYFYSMTYKEIAQNFNKSENTIKSWISRALPKMKKCLENYL